MKLECVPTKFECYDYVLQDLIFNIECVDECSAMVEIKVPINTHDWDNISSLIRDALIAMRLKGDKIE
jgi:hypothetical protein